MARRTQQTKADLAIAALTPEQRDYLQRELIDKHANATEIHRWLVAEVNPELKYDTVLTWYNREFPVGVQAQTVNQIVAEARGVSCIDAHAAALALIVLLAEEVRKEVQALGLKDIPPAMLGNLVDLAREQRQSAQALHNTQRLEDRRSLILSGAYRLAEIVANFTRDTDRFEVVKGVIDAGLARLEEEV